MMLRFIGKLAGCFRRVYDGVRVKQSRTMKNEKSAAVFAVRRANYTHRRKGVFNVESIEDLAMSGNVRYRTDSASNVKRLFVYSEKAE